MAIIGRSLLPTRQAPDEEETGRQLRAYISEVRVLPDSRLANQTLLESRLGAEYDLTVIAIIRGEIVRTNVDRDSYIQPHNHLIVGVSACC